MPKVLTVEMNVLEQTYPLISGYLRAFAKTIPEVRAAYEFDTYCPERTDEFDTIMDELLARNADVYALSCYVWNMAMMERLFEGLQALRPDATIILGGPEVMGRGSEILPNTAARVIICNGEGELVFANILTALLAPIPNLSAVNGISFLEDGEVITTAPQDRLKNLDQIPSPFLTKEIPGHFRTTTFETNRGCPFKCAFCYWGAANNDRVFKFSEDRIHAEIEEIGRLRFPGIYIADANWGMTKRDIEFSKHFVDCKARYSTPFTVAFTSSKNSPDRVAEITRIFADGNLASAQPISFQTLTETALDAVERSNIKLAAYDSLMKSLNENGFGSFVELMWPLPGETLESFRLVTEEVALREPTAMVIYAHVGPVTELFRSFDLVFCYKGETSWHRNQPRSSAQKQRG